MPIVKTYACPDCEAEFDFMHMTREEPPPSYCPKCGAFVGDEPQAVPKMPRLGGGNMAKSAEQVQQMMEDSAVARAELAAGHTPGTSASDMVSAMRALASSDAPAQAKAASAQAPVAQAAIQAAQSGISAQLGPQLAQGTRAGPYPNMGSAVAAKVAAEHGAVERAVVGAGRMAKG